MKPSSIAHVNLDIADRAITHADAVPTQQWHRVPRLVLRYRTLRICIVSCMLACALCSCIPSLTCCIALQGYHLQLLGQIVSIIHRFKLGDLNPPKQTLAAGQLGSLTMDIVMIIDRRKILTGRIEYLRYLSTEY